MSLLRLLTSGKSLVGVQCTDSRYRLTRHKLLPQFGSAKNPFINRRDQVPAQTEAPLLAIQQDKGASEEQRSVARSSASPTAGPASVFQRAAQDTKISAKARGGRFIGALWRKATSFLGGWRSKASTLIERPRATAAKPAIPRLPKLPVQGELSLDKIRVVRNDLSDADLEVVTSSGPAPAARPEAGLPNEQRTELAEDVLGREMVRTAGVGKP